MANTRYWTGETDTDWAVTTNWTDDTVPIDGDTVIFDGRTTVGALLNMTQSAIDLAGLYIMSTYTGTIGAADAPLEIEISGDLRIEGTGSYYIQSGAVNNTTDGAIDRTYIDTTGNVYLSSQYNNADYVSKFTIIVIVRGTLTVYGDADKTDHGGEAGTVIDSLYLAPTSNRKSNVTVTIGDGCYNLDDTTYTNIWMGNGELTCYSSLGTVYFYDGDIDIGGTGYSMQRPTIR